MYKLNKNCILDFSEQGLTSLDELPNGLKILYCYSNNITSLPELPEGLLTIACEYNKLTSLPKLPESLIEIDCFNNNIKYLPELPDGLTDLFCGYNPLECIIPYKYQHYQNKYWVDDYYMPYISSYEGQKNILTKQPHMVGELIKQTKILPEIMKQFGHLFNCSNLNLL